ncbi:hypothetical protein K469DRAFT_754779 [Zopfia rhizophila CBS 207.26]|uniref:HTH CENPB-type domain-containing protein n=1 Tax=Zopfia rhizophila CBS 207.26 TaxID=1314779 RepID=A0A6A6DEZ8_9PEZI|nr:hypothetical protein K469DRAFT_754779 [Zopfia rhizophila CBS 207.26]
MAQQRPALRDIAPNQLVAVRTERTKLATKPRRGPKPRDPQVQRSGSYSPPPIVHGASRSPASARAAAVGRSGLMNIIGRQRIERLLYTLIVRSTQLRAGGERRQGSVQKEAHPAVEFELYLLINALRDLHRAVSTKMIKRRGRKLLRDQDPVAAQSFKFSSGWFQGFVKRWRYSWRCQTKKAQLKPEELQLYVNNWLCFF